MPNTCFSYPPGGPASIPDLDSASSQKGVDMPETGPCFSYTTGGGNRDAVPAGLRRMPASSTCFRYPPDVAPGVRQMPTGTACFRYRPEVPRTMPNMCFSYPPAEPADLGDRDDMPPGPRQMSTGGTCFRY